MYYPPLFTSVRPFDPRANPLDVPVSTRENPLDLSVKTIRQTPDSTGDNPEDLLMLDHRKLASLAAASHSLSSVMGRQLGAGAALIDPAALFRLGYAPDGTPLAAMIPGLAPPFCYDRASGVAVPTSLASHQLMSSFIQQQQQRERCLEQQALFAARTTAQQQAAVAAAFMDPAMHLRNGMSQREAAAALAATRGLYAPALPTPMVLPAFSLYTEDKGAFTSLRTSSGDKSYLNGSGLNNTALETARFAEHLQRLREQHLQQHPTGKCSNACCTSLSGMPQTSVPCVCCVQSPPSQSALCARSPMGSSTKDPTTAATGKACDFLQPSMSFLHRPAVTTATPNSTNTSDLRLSVSSLCTTVANTDTTTTSASKMSSVFSPAGIWNAGLPTVSTSGKTAFSVPKKKEVQRDSSHNKETKPSANIKDILKDSNVSFDSRKYDVPTTTKSNVPIKTENMKREDSKHYKDDHSSKYYKNVTSSHDVKPFMFPKHSPKSNGLFNGNDALTTVTSVTPIVPTKCEGGTIPIARMPPLLEAVRPTDHLSFREHFQDSSSLSNPQGPPPLIAASNGETASLSVSSKSAKIPYISTSASTPMFLGQAVPAFKNPSESKPKSSESSKSQKSSKKSSSQPIPKFSALPPGFIKEEPMLPKPIPHLPPPIYPSHYRPGQHQMSLQTHNGWIPPAHPNVTVAPPPVAIPSTTSSTSAPATISTTAIKPELFFTSPTIKREPDYADTPNVLQSLLIRSAHGLDPLAVAPTSIPTATSVITPLSAPLFGLDYRYHFGHQLGLPKPDATIYGLQTTPAGVAQPKDKPDSAKSESSKSSKKRSNGLVNGQSHSDESATKKRFIEYSNPLPRYSFQPSTFASEAAEAPECPYTFIAEPPLNYTGQPKLEAKERSVKLETPEKSRCHPVPSEEVAKTEDISDKPPKKLQKPAVKSSTFHECYRISDRIRARSKLRKRLLARIYQQRRPLATGVPDKSQIDKEIALQHTRKLLSQISLRWSHRRYLYKWYAARRKAVDSARRKRKCDVYKVKNERLVKRGKQEVPDVEESVAKASSNVSPIPIPFEMKRLMVNKAVGETILHRAARLGYPEVVAYCLQKFAGNVNTRNNAGFTPLHECCSKGHLDIARALLQYGADVNASAAGGIRPLHDAVENDHVEVVRLLLSYGADPTIATYSGLEPLKLARSPFMAEFLQGFLADISGEADSRPHLPWRFWGSVSCLDPEETGCDVFDGVPPDPEDEGEGDNDFLFEVSDSPHLPTFRLAATSKAQCNYLRLSDVLRKLSIPKEDFVARHGHIEVLSLPKHEFEASATCSQLLTGTKMDAPSPGSRTVPDRFLDSGDTTDLVRLDSSIRQVLGIETISVR